MCDAVAVWLLTRQDFQVCQNDVEVNCWLTSIEWKVLSRWCFHIFLFYVHPYLGKISNLTNIFQMGWNHQPVMELVKERLLVDGTSRSNCPWPKPIPPGRCQTLFLMYCTFHSRNWIYRRSKMVTFAAQLYIYKLDMMLGSHLVWLVLMLESCQSHLCTLSETYTIH